MIECQPGAEVESDDEARQRQRRRCWNNIAPALVQPPMFARYAMHWAGHGLLFPYTVRTAAQCFLCFIIYYYAYFNFNICMFFFTYITCFVIITVLDISSIIIIKKNRAIGILKGLAQAKITKTSVILFWVLNMTI